MIACYAHAYGSADGFARYLPRNHVGIPCREAGEELQNGDLKRGRCVCVYTIVSFYDDEARLIVIGGD